MYQNKHGRFTAVDPLLASGKSANAQTFNRYSYTTNRPLAFVDTTGLFMDDWYIRKDGNIEVFRTDDSFDRFFVFDENHQEFTLKAQLEKNAFGLVEFPLDGWGFTNYNPGERGGYDPYAHETVGQGDRWLKPLTAAALFGLTNQLRNEFGITLALNDMSSSNGSDPWDAKFRKWKDGKLEWNGHHAGHGHNGNRTGLDIDWRYVDKNGNSQHGVFTKGSTLFDVKLNESIYRTANKWGFNNNYTGKNTPISGVTHAKGHDDHGHFGFTSLRVTELKHRPTTQRAPEKPPRISIIPPFRGYQIIRP